MRSLIPDISQRLGGRAITCMQIGLTPKVFVHSPRIQLSQPWHSRHFRLGNSLLRGESSVHCKTCSHIPGFCPPGASSTALPTETIKNVVRYFQMVSSKRELPPLPPLPRRPTNSEMSWGRGSAPRRGQRAPVACALGEREGRRERALLRLGLKARGACQIHHRTAVG